MTTDQLYKVNAQRFKDINYLYTIAPKNVYGITKKIRITESPFLRRMEYGTTIMDIEQKITLLFNLKAVSIASKFCIKINVTLFSCLIIAVGILRRNSIK